MSTISDSHRTVMPSDSPKPGSGEERPRRAPGLASWSEVEMKSGCKGVALRHRSDRVERRVVAAETDPVEHQFAVGIEIPVEARGNARCLVARARGHWRPR